MAENTAALDERNWNRVRFAVRADRTNGPTPGLQNSETPEIGESELGAKRGRVNMQSKAGMSFRNSKMDFEHVLFPFGKRRKSRDRSQKTGARF